MDRPGNAIGAGCASDIHGHFFQHHTIQHQFDYAASGKIAGIQLFSAIERAGVYFSRQRGDVLLSGFNAGPGARPGLSQCLQFRAARVCLCLVYGHATTFRAYGRPGHIGRSGFSAGAAAQVLLLHLQCAHGGLYVLSGQRSCGLHGQLSADTGNDDDGTGRAWPRSGQHGHHQRDIGIAVQHQLADYADAKFRRVQYHPDAGLRRSCDVQLCSNQRAAATGRPAGDDYRDKNANGQLNVKNASIVSASGGNTGTFTLNVSLPDASAEPEQGQGTTAGTVFNFDPGAGLLGSSTDPIYGNATGGSLTFGGTSGNFMAAGTRQGVVFFITRNGAVTFPSPPVVFSAAGNTITGIQASNLPIGPPNVIARGVAFTEAGQNGVPGANFYYIPNNVEYTILNQQFTATSTAVNDNSTTSAVFTFPDSVLLSATAIDVQGNNLFNQIEIGDPAWNTSYAGRLFFGGCRAKVQNFLNLSFDGGFLSNPGGAILPLGWKVDANYTPSGAVTLLNSPVFGNSLYIHNPTGSSASIFGMLTQSAYEDAYQVPIVRPSTAYSVRVTCRCPSGAASGALVIDLTDSNSTGYGQTFGSFTVNLSGMTSSMQTFTGTLLTTSFSTVPPGLLLRVWLQNAPNNADVEIDRIEVFPTLQPVDSSKVYVSYVDNPEGVDGVTGILDLSVQNTQPVTGAAVMYDLLYIMKESSLYSTQDSPNDEPANWAIHEVSNRVGAIGPNAWDYGEEWLVMACRDGVYVFNGGQPAKINQEIWQIWEAINWAAGKTIWVRNDIVNRKLYVGVPLPTPNPWIPNPRTANANPAQPNVVLVCSYLGLDAVTSFMEAPQVHTTMFGNLMATDMRRKWSIWQIPSPYADFIARGNQSGQPDQQSSPLVLGNGVGSQRCWQFGHAPGIGYASSTLPPSDVDLGAIPSLYTTYGFVNSAKAKENQLLGYHSKRFNYMQALIDGQTYAGNPLTITMLSNTLNADAVHTYQVPGGVILTSPAQEELERPLNVRGQRIFAQFAVNQPGTSGQAGWFGLSRLIMVGAADAWAPIRGR